MAEMEMAISNRVISRNRFGQFIADCEAAGQQTVDDALSEMEDAARILAPTGYKIDRRTTPLHDSFFINKLSRTSGVLGNFARHALAIEKGARPHLIVGQPFMKFFWEEENRMWVPGLFGEPDIINHPGNAAQPFMLPAYTAVMKRVMQIARRHYPGR